MAEIGGIGSVGQVITKAASGAGTSVADGSFGDILKGLVTQAVDAQKTAEAMTQAAASGDSVALSDVIQAVSKAEITLQTLVSVRDKAVDAYQQIMQMPV